MHVRVHGRRVQAGGEEDTPTFSVAQHSRPPSLPTLSSLSGRDTSPLSSLGDPIPVLGPVPPAHDLRHHSVPSVPPTDNLMPHSWQGLL